MADRETTVERIACAALLRPGALTPDVSRPPERHHDIIQRLAALGVGPGQMGPATQGFVTTIGRFVGREEAWRIAVAAGQLLPARNDGGMEVRRTAPPPNGRLYSEDVW